MLSKGGCLVAGQGALLLHALWWLSAAFEKPLWSLVSFNFYALTLFRTDGSSMQPINAVLEVEGYFASITSCLGYAHNNYNNSMQKVMHRDLIIKLIISMAASSIQGFA